MSYIGFNFPRTDRQFMKSTPRPESSESDKDEKVQRIYTEITSLDDSSKSNLRTGTPISLPISGNHSSQVSIYGHPQSSTRLASHHSIRNRDFHTGFRPRDTLSHNGRRNPGSPPSKLSERTQRLYGANVRKFSNTYENDTHQSPYFNLNDNQGRRSGRTGMKEHVSGPTSERRNNGEIVDVLDSDEETVKAGSNHVEDPKYLPDELIAKYDIAATNVSIAKSSSSRDTKHTNNAKNRAPVVIEDSEDDHEYRNNSNSSTRGSTPVERIESKVKPKKSGRSVQTVLAFGEDRRDPIQVDVDNDDELQPKVSKKSSKKKPPVVQPRTHQTRLSAKRSLSDLVSMNCSAIFIGRKIQDKNVGLKLQVDLKESAVKMTAGKLFKAFSAKDIRCIYYDISGAHSNCISIHLYKQPSDLPVDIYSYDVESPLPGTKYITFFLRGTKMEQENVLSALCDLQTSAENMRVLEWPKSSLEDLHSVLEKCYPSYIYNYPVRPRSQSVNNNVSAATSTQPSRSGAKPKAISAGSFYGASGASSSTKSATEYGARASDDDDLDFKEDDIARPPARSKFSTEKAPVTRAYNTRHSNRNSSTRTQNVYEFDSLQGFSNEIRGKVESLISYHHLDASKELFIYPFQGKDCVTMMKNDLLRLEEGEFLNDTIIQFYLKYILDTTLAHRNHDTHIFSTFFYKKLSDKVHLKDLDKGYARVRKWTSKVNLFEKKYVFVPVNENLHWYLALIVNPAKCLEEEVEKHGVEDIDSTLQLNFFPETKDHGRKSRSSRRSSISTKHDATTVSGGEEESVSSATAFKSFEKGSQSSSSGSSTASKEKENKELIEVLSSPSPQLQAEEWVNHDFELDDRNHESHTRKFLEAKKKRKDVKNSNTFDNLSQKRKKTESAVSDGDNQQFAGTNKESDDQEDIEIVNQRSGRQRSSSPEMMDLPLYKKPKLKSPRLEVEVIVPQKIIHSPSTTVPSVSASKSKASSSSSKVVVEVENRKGNIRPSPSNKRTTFEDMEIDDVEDINTKIEDMDIDIGITSSKDGEIHDNDTSIAGFESGEGELNFSDDLNGKQSFIGSGQRNRNLQRGHVIDISDSPPPRGISKASSVLSSTKEPSGMSRVSHVDFVNELSEDSSSASSAPGTPNLRPLSSNVHGKADKTIDLTFEDDEHAKKQPLIESTVDLLERVDPDISNDKESVVICDNSVVEAQSKPRGKGRLSRRKSSTSTDNNQQEKQEWTLEKLVNGVLDEELGIDLERPYIIVFDSLPGTQKTRVVNVLNRYLDLEAQDKLSLPAPTKCARINASNVPLQPNHCDCGIYLLHYCETFLSDPDRYLRLILAGKKINGISEWGPTEVTRKRNAIYDTIAETLVPTYKKFREEKAAASLASSSNNNDSSVPVSDDDDIEVISIKTK